MSQETNRFHNGIKVEKEVTVQQPPETLYRIWRNFKNLPRFMENLESVNIMDNKRSHWVVKGPAGMKIEWDAEIIRDVENQMISWQSIGNPDVATAGSVHFQPAPGDKGTEVKVILQYDPPAGTVGATIAKFLGKEPSQQIDEDLKRFKQLMESGEIPTAEM